MNYRDLKRAKIGDRVAFRPLPGDAGEYAEGTITSFSPSKNKATIQWEDGEVSQINDASYDRIELLATPPILTADLTQATAVTINQLREALAKEKLQGNGPTERRPPPRGGRD
jgi:hypothetical protein